MAKAAEKKPEMTRQQQILLASKGYIPGLYEILQDYPHSMLIRNIQTQEPAVIFKD